MLCFDGEINVINVILFLNIALHHCCILVTDRFDPDSCSISSGVLSGVTGETQT